MWIFLSLMACIVTGVSADESRDALIAAGCVAGGLLLISIGVFVGIFIARHKQGKVKKTYSRHPTEHIPNGFHHLHNNPSRVSSASDLPTEEHRILGSKAFTQNALNPRLRPPVAFYTVRTDPRMILELPGLIPIGPPVHARPPPVGRPVIFLDRNNPPGYLTNGGPFLSNESSHSSKQSIHQRSRSSGRDRKNRSRSKSRSKSRSRSRNTNRSRHQYNDTNLMSVEAAPGDLFMQARDDDSGIYDNSNKHEANNNNSFQMLDIDQMIETEPKSTLNQTAIVHNAANVKDDIRLPSDLGPFSITQMQTRNSIHPSDINATTYKRGALHTDVSEEILQGIEQDPLPSPKLDYPIDSPRASMLSETSQVDVKESISLIKSSPNKNHISKETPWVDYPRLQTDNNGRDDFIEMYTMPANRSGSKKNKDKKSDNTLSHRQDPSLVRPPSPPLEEKPETPPFRRIDAMVHPHTLSLVKSNEDIMSHLHTRSQIPTPPPDMSPVESESYVLNMQGDIRPPTPPNLYSEYVEYDLPTFPPTPTANFKYDLPAPPPLPTKNRKYNLPTPPPLPSKKEMNHTQTTAHELISHDQEFNIDDILNIGKEPSITNAVDINKSSMESLNRESGLPFIEELMKRQRSNDNDEVFHLSPTSTSSRKPPPMPTHFKDHILGTKMIEGNGKENSQNITDLILPQRSSTVQFTEEPPEIFHRQDSQSSGRYDEQKDNNVDTTSTYLASIPPPPPLPPSLLK